MSFSLTVQASLGNRYAGILLAAQLYRAEKLAAREAKILAQLHRAHRWRTHEALSDRKEDNPRQGQDKGA